MDAELSLTKSLLLEAASQRILMQPWIDDLAFENDGGRVWYAVDTDVVKLFTAPRNNAVSEGKRPGYAEMFSAQNRQHTVALGYALSEFIFFELGRMHDRKLTPLLLLPGHDEELEFVLDATQNSALNDQSRHYQIETWLRATKKRIKALDENYLLDEFERQFPKYLVTFGHRDTAAMELARYRNRLWKNRRLMPVSLLPNLPADGEERRAFADIAPALAEPTSEREKTQLGDLRRNWYEHLRAIPPRKSSWSLFADAQALARLEWISRRLQADGDAHRIVLISGDRKIEAALARLDPAYAQSSGMRLRHPRAYVGVPEIIVPALKKTLEDIAIDQHDADAPDFVGWLDTLLAEVESTGGNELLMSSKIAAMNEPEIEALASSTMEKRPHVVSEFKNRFSSYLYGVVKAQANTLGSGGMEDTLFEMLASRGVTREQLLESVREELNKGWNELFYVSVLVGGSNALSVVDTPKLQPTRIPPPIVFDLLQDVQGFFQYLMERRIREDEPGIEGPLEGEFRRHLDAVKKVDEHNYCLFLAHAAIFAYTGNWHLVETTAEMACTAAVDASKGNPEITGREAWLLLSTARRHNAREAADLGSAIAALDRAEEIYRRDVRPSKGSCALELRADAERIAIAIENELFLKFDPKQSTHGDGEISLESKEYCLELAARLEGLIEIADRLIDGESDEYRKSAWMIVKRHLLCNWFTVHLSLLDGELLLTPKFVKISRHFQMGLQTEVERRPAFLARLLVLTVDVLFAPGRAERKRIANTAKSHLLESNHHLVMQYDLLRYEHLRDIVERAINASIP